MNKWRLEYLLKNGSRIVGLHIGPETESSQVVNKLMVGPLNAFVGTFGQDEKHNLLVMRGEIAAVDISEWR